jgi:Fe-S cluster assembly ATP-binding protein
MLTLSNIQASVDGKDILKGISLNVKPGEIHAIMGPNGSGKSTMSKILTGHPDYDVTSGQIIFKGEDLSEADAAERSLKGLFLAFQYPVEIPGVNNEDFLRMAYNAKQKHLGLEEADPLEFDAIVQEKLTLLDMNETFLNRSVNHGFSGGEKKRNEILQMLILNPDLIILDESDSGLDIDALRIVSKAVNYFKDSNKAFIIITHYQRLLNYITPDVVHVLAGGKIVKSGDKSLALELEEKGYDWITEGVVG